MASLTKTCRHSRIERESCACAWYVRRRVRGRDTYTPVGSDRRTAERTLARLEAAKGETMAEAVDAWLAMKEAQPNARANSVHTYRSRAKHVHRALGAIPVAAIRHEHLARFVDGLIVQGHAPSTVRGIYALVTGTLRHARRRGVIQDLPLPPDGPGIPATQERKHELTLRQVDEVIGRMPGVWGRVAEVVFLTGLRWGEVVHIRPEDVEDDVLWVRGTADRYGGANDPKTASGFRVMPLSPRAHQILTEELSLPVGGSYTVARNELVRAMGSLHRKGMGWHSLRAAHSTLLDVAGVSLREAAARMGHGHRYAQTLAYRVRGEAGGADVIDLARARHGREAAG